MELLVLWLIRVLVALAFGGLGYLSSSSATRVPNWMLLIGAGLMLVVCGFELLTGRPSLTFIAVPWLTGLGIGHLRRKPRAQG